MRLWVYIFPFIFGAVGYFTYGWAATNGDHWMAIAVALCCLIAQQVSITSLATAYAMECFDGVCDDLFFYLIYQLIPSKIDLRRAGCRAGNLLLAYQLCHLLLRTAFHRYHQLRVDVHLLRAVSGSLRAGGDSHDYLGQSLATEMQGAV